MHAQSNSRNTRRKCNMFKVNNNDSRAMMSFCSGADRVLYRRSAANIYPFKVNNIDTRLKCEICSELKMKKSERSQKHRPEDDAVGFEHTSTLVIE